MQEKFKQDPIYMKKKLSSVKDKLNMQKPYYSSQQLLMDNGQAYGSQLGTRLGAMSSYRFTNENMIRALS